VLELIDYFAPAEPGQSVRAVPGEGLRVPLWILGSSLYGAQLAAAFGLPFAFASHFAPAQMMQAIEIYRSRFQPSQQLERPYVMLGFNVFAADSDDEARFLATSMQQAFVNLRSGRPTTLPPPRAGYESELPAYARSMLDEVLSCSAIGSPATVRDALRTFIARTEADELIAHLAHLRACGAAALVRDRRAGCATRWPSVERVQLLRHAPRQCPGTQRPSAPHVPTIEVSSPVLLHSNATNVARSETLLAMRGVQRSASRWQQSETGAMASLSHCAR